MSTPYFRSVEMQILTHHIYEYNKDLRSLVLHTMNTEEKPKTKNY